MKPNTQSFPPPTATGPVLAELPVAVPPGHAQRKIFAGLKRDGRLVARAEVLAGTGDRVTVPLRGLTADATLPEGEYELWLTIDYDGWQSCYPGFDDWYVRATWSLPQESSPAVLADPLVWKLKRCSKPGNLVTIHYHRYDGDYDNIGLWTWDAHTHRTPAQNELYEIGRDEFGLIYQLDRGEYGAGTGADQIGLLPRLAGDWNRKDGEDKFWAPRLGPEVYLIGTKNQVWTRWPDIYPHVAAAFIDAPNRVVVQLSRLLEEGTVLPASVHLVDDQERPFKPVAVRLFAPSEKQTSTYLEAILFDPLDVAHHGYRVSVDQFAGTVAAVPRGVLDEADLFGDITVGLGATYSPRATTFRLFAPTAQSVHLVLYDQPDGSVGRTTSALSRAPKGVWETTVAGDLEGKFYLFSLDGPDLSPEREALDIYSVNTVRNSQRARITALARTNPSGWETGRRGPALESPVDMIIYEMHVRDFTIAANSGVQQRGKFLGFAEAGTRLPGDGSVRTGLDHLVELGVTHVQLMPVADFDNDETGPAYNWGYMPVAFNSPDGWFASQVDDDSRVRELKRLIQALHERGLGVILDVVYNHTGSSASFNHLVPRYYYRFLPDGRYANGSGCGNEFRSESPMGRKCLIDSLKFWVKEYGVDGFRFDLMALLDLETIQEAEHELRRINPQLVLYGEPWTAAPTPLQGRAADKSALRHLSLGAFNDDFRNAVKGPPDGPEPGFIQGGGNRDAVRRALGASLQDWVPVPAQSINYLACHDNLVLYDKLKLSQPGATEEQIVQMMKLGYLLLFTAQGVPFLHGGEEFARSKQGDPNSYNAPDAINQVDWSRKRSYYELFAYVRDLIALRRAHPAFRLRTKAQVLARLRLHDTTDAHTLMYTLDGAGLADEPWGQLCVLVNSADASSGDFALPRGPWHVAFDSQGPVREERVAEGTYRVRYKSGVILHQS